MIKFPKLLQSLQKDLLPGGKGDARPIKDFDLKEYEMGLKVESEHTKRPAVASEVARDHLSEDPNYYSKLKDSGLADELDKAYVSPHNTSAAENFGTKIDPQYSKYLGNYKIGKHTIHVRSDGEDGVVFHSGDLGNPTGVVSVSSDSHRYEKEGDGGYAVDHAVVAKEHRGRGIGGALYIAAINHFKELRSSAALSPHSDKMWRNLSHPNIKVLHADPNDEDAQYQAEWIGKPLKLNAAKPKLKVAKPKLKVAKSLDFEDLEKGLKGDWKKEGYTLHVEGVPEYGNSFTVYAKKNGRQVGYAGFAHNGDHLYPEEAEVHHKHTRKGLASAMYSHAERISGVRAVPSEIQSPAAEALWAQKNRPFGKSEDLEKSAPYKEGLPNGKGDISVKHPQYGNVYVYKHSPEKRANYQNILNQHKEKFLNNFQGKDKDSLSLAISKIEKHPRTDWVPTKNMQNMQQEPRLRHVAFLTSGHKDSNLTKLNDGEFLWRQSRHPDDPKTGDVTYWKISHGNISDVTNDYQKNQQTQIVRKSSKVLSKSSDKNINWRSHGYYIQKSNRGSNNGNPGQGVRSSNKGSVRPGVNSGHRVPRDNHSGDQRGHSSLGKADWPKSRASRVNEGTVGKHPENRASKLNKGLRGDWKKEGYEIGHEKKMGGHIYVYARHPKDPLVAGMVMFHPDHMIPLRTYVGDAHKRKGLASAMYKYAEKLTGKKMNRGEIQSDEAKALWAQKNRPFGKSIKADKHVATVAVISGDNILMGKRLDNGKWTNPGGHMEDNESAHEGALRELFEEAGIEPDSMHKLGSEPVKKGDKTLMIHCFTCFGKYNHTPKNDPDKEVAKWEWVNVRNGLPEEVANNLHSPKNILLRLLGLQDE